MYSDNRKNDKRKYNFALRFFKSDEYGNAFKDNKLWVERQNRKHILMVSTVIFIMIGFLMLLAPFDQRSFNNLKLYVPFEIALCVIFLFTKFHNTEDLKFTGWMIYVNMAVIIIYSILLGTLVNSDFLSATFDTAIVALPIFFIDKPKRIISFIVICGILFFIMALSFDSRSVIYTDIVNGFCFTVISLFISNNMINTKMENKLNEMKLINMSTMDLLTKLKNRNSFERELNGYPDKCSRTVSCVYLDVNGLHELNNTKGHKAGDKMLQYIAASFQAEFGEEESYRIGGDEYVAFVPDISSKAVELSVKNIHEASEKEGYHVSIGVAVASKPDIDMETLLKLAEEAMFKEKREYYSRIGVDRRHRRR